MLCMEIKCFVLICNNHELTKIGNTNFITDSRVCSSTNIQLRQQWQQYALLYIKCILSSNIIMAYCGCVS